MTAPPPTTIDLGSTLGERYDSLTTIREMFPRCACCGRDLSGERLTALVYLPVYRRFACTTCPNVA